MIQINKEPVIPAPYFKLALMLLHNCLLSKADGQQMRLKFLNNLILR